MWVCCGRLSYRLQEAMPGGFASFSRWFSSFCLREASCSETHKQNRLSVATMVLLGTRGPLLYQVIRGAYALAMTWNGPAAIDCLHSIHYPVEIFANGHIRPSQFL